MLVWRTEHGIPHIVADDDAGIGYGYGYVVAQDQICPLAESYVTVAGERSRYFGPDGRFDFYPNNSHHSNLSSDLFYRQLNESGLIDGLVNSPAPVGPKPGVRELVRGYVRGYNRRLAEVGGASGVSDPACRGEPWVKPITEAQAYGRFAQIASLAGGSLAITGIAGAQPPAGGGAAAAGSADVAELGRRLQHALGRHRVERDRPRPREDPVGSGNGARQPPPDLAGRRAALPGALHDPRGDGRVRRHLRRRPARGDRAHAPPGVEPHDLERVPLHALRAAPRRRLPDHLRRRRAGAADDQPPRDRPGQERRRLARRGQPDALVDGVRPCLQRAAWPAALPVDGHERLRVRRRQRAQPALPQPLLRGRPGAVGPRARGDPATPPGHPVGEHARRRLRRPRPLRRRLGGPARDRRQGGELQHPAGGRRVPPAAAPGAGRLALRVRVGHRPRRRAARHLRARQPAVPRALRLRRELQRLALAQQSGAAARGLRPDHRRRAQRAVPADSPRAADGPRARASSRSPTCRS